MLLMVQSQPLPAVDATCLWLMHGAVAHATMPVSVVYQQLWVAQPP